MVVLGADPDAPARETDWEEFTPIQRTTNPRTVRLVNYFGYHRSMTFNQRFNDFDKKILSGYVSKMIKRGYGQHDIQEMMDKFWQSWGAEYSEPAPAFVSVRMQEALTTGYTPNTTNLAIEWLLHGMPNDGPFDDPSDVRRAVVLCSGELTHRYPDVVAEIIGLDKGYAFTRRLLLAADDLVQWNLGHDPASFDIDHTLHELRNIELPNELKSNKRARKSLRLRRPTIAQAVTFAPIKRNNNAKLLGATGMEERSMVEIKAS